MAYAAHRGSDPAQPVDCSEPSGAGTLDENGSEPISNDQGSLLTILPECELTDQANEHMDTLGVQEMFADVSTKEDVDTMVDEATWIPIYKNIEASIQNKLITGILMFHAGVSHLTDAAMDQGKRNIDHDTMTSARRAAALFVRLVSLLTLAVSPRLPVILVCSWRPG